MNSIADRYKRLSVLCFCIFDPYHSLAGTTEQSDNLTSMFISSLSEPLSTTPEGITDTVTPSVSACDFSGEINPVIQSGDFGHIVKLKAQRSLTEDEKYYLMKHHFVPSKRYNFAAHSYGDRQRHFQGSWLDKYNDLVYSESDDGGYCKFCMLLAHFQPSVSELGVLVICPLTNLKKATEKLKNHFISEERKSHHEAIQTPLTFCAVKENRVLPIDQQLSSIRATLVKKII